MITDICVNVLKSTFSNFDSCNNCMHHMNPLNDSIIHQAYVLKENELPHCIGKH